MYVCALSLAEYFIKKVARVKKKKEVLEGRVYIAVFL